ncbi:hypothetical protein C2869_19970 [Saccharobesus litoralis]|uniref:Type 4 fimbrial biogenesis protein PilX N-terminal domain-containing protein n=1 Tax=Saccharobesus litoralis TaxID=2172099 RepID=A0A2S0VWE0_9ALTE|nr:hypothetical protein [Saccharobesus litoralis]AWB68537.1 hypothetical protein C2869_19970 [Saccharobesus litoralis]
MTCHRLKLQTGAALFAGLVFTALITALAVSVLSNSVMDQKIAAANAEQMSSVDKAMGGVAQTIYKALYKQINGTDFFAHNKAMSSTKLEDGLYFTSDINVTDDLSAETSATGGCAREKYGDDASTISCKNFTVTVTNSYGKNNSATTTVEAGISYKANNSDG